MKNVMVNTSVKRLAMAVALVWCVMLGVKAQAVLFHESFDSGVLPTGWTIVDANNDGYNWDASFRYQQNPSAAHSGDGMIASMSSYVYGVGTITPDNWLISPAINIPDGAVLTFWIKGQESSSYYAENYSVYVASSNNVTELEATTPLLTKSAFNDWEEQVVDLSSFAGQTVYIAFRHLGATNIYWLGLDDVEVRKPSISVSSEMLDFGQVPLFRERTVPIMVKGYNLRSPITVSTTAPFYVSVDSVSFVNTVTIRENGVLFVKYVPTSVSNANSMISLASDTVLETITVKGSGVDCSQRKVVPYSEQFEGDWFPPVCWNLISQQDKTWTKISKWASCLGSNDNKIEQLETCVFDFSQVSNNLLMSFDFQSNDYYVTYNYVDLKIYVSKDGGSTYESTPIWTLSSYGSFNSWTTTTAIVDISGLTGESNIRFKFSYEGRLCQVVFCNLQIKEIPVSPERVVYVKSGATGSNDGTSWNNAFTDLQEAINQVYGLDSLSIWVAAGTYFGDTTKTSAFKVSKSMIVNIFGGFAGDEPANYDLSLRDFETNATVLDGLHNRQVLYVSSYNPDYPMVFDGFTLQNGVADQGGGAEMHGKVTLSNCIIQYNTSNNSGGGVYCYDANEILNCKICYNHGRYGGGISSYLTDVSNCVICNNSSSYDGGGFSSSHDKVSNCLINNNTSGQSGGGIVSRESEIINTTIVRNTAISNGAGISVGEYGSSNISNSIVWGNMRGDSLDNFYGNGLQCYACAMDGESVGVHAIVINNDNTYPCFVNPSNISGYEDTTSNVDWHLTQWSPCVNRGENMLVSRLKDLDNMPRIQVDTVDMGCYESGYTNTQSYPFEGIVYVTPTGSGTGSGDSWNNAMSSLQDAITLAQSRSCVVWVAAGTYFGNTDSAALNAFTMINGVNVYGGFAGNEPENYDLSLRDFETNSTILDGQNTRRVLYQKSDFGVETVWDGFTIQNGLVRNEAGGGVYLCGNSILKHCLVRNNEIEGSNCGGGIYAYGSSSHKAKIVQCSVSNNISYNGAGICAHYALIESSRVTHNKSIYYGGGMSTSNCKIINCQIANNTSTEAAAGGIEANNDTIINTTIVRNSSAYRDVGAGLSGYARMSNCIVWGNETDGVSNNLRGSGDRVVCSHCAIEGGLSGENMVLLENGSNVVNFVNPSLSAGVFDSTANVDWHLAPTSIFINRGDNSFVTDSVDLAGIARIKRDTVDLGCYESDYYSVPMTEYNGIVYVTQTGAGTRSGNCWANATASFSHAQLIAQTYNAVVWVAAGTYYGDTTLNSENAFSMVEGVKVYGGFVGNESPEYDLTLRDCEVNATILDGQNKRKVLNRPNDYNTVVRETIWDGFTIQNGFGGGVSMSDNTILSNCLVRYNEGGGITASGSSNRKAKIRYCTVENNTSSSNGAGIYAYYTDIEHCVVAYNYYSEDYYGGGGGIYAYGSEVKNTEVFKNRSNAYGGGILINERSQVKNCLVANNSSKNNEGSGISGNGNVTNTTIVRNASASNGAGVCITGKLVNCIVWGNQDNSGLSNNVQGDNVQCLYSAIEDDYERDNIVLLSEYNNQYPHFVRPSLTAGAFDTTANVDWHLMSNSVCINRGLNTALSDSLDLDGTARIKCDTVDLGCYESDYYSIPLTEYNGVVYVTESGAGNRSGNSWSNAMSSVRMAMTLAKSYNLMVWVASGTYYGDVDSTSENAFTMMDGINVYGGFIGNESANFDLSMRDFEANATILDGQNRKRVLYQPSDFNTKTTWDGFVIQNGYVNGNGGGVFMRNNAVLCHCLVQNNISTTPYSDDWRNTEVRYGGGIYAVGSTNTNPITRPVIRRCRIKNNKVENNNSYSYNSCHGAGVYASCINIENSEVVYNMTQGSGGGLFLNSQCFVNNCLIANNTSNSYGGGVNINMGSEIVNSTIVRNASGYEGAGVNFSSSSSSYKNTMTNCIVWGNRKQDGTISNIQGNYILYSNTAVEDDFEREDVILLSEHNNQHPQFANPSLTAGWTDSTENVDWHLQQGSICINRGDNAAVLDSVDLDEMVRIKRDTVDLGCYESDYFSTPLTEYSGIVYVTQTGAGDFSGNSWENAKSSINGAQLLSSVYDAVVWVAAGTYYGDTASDTENAFTMYDGVNVYGGFAGNEPANYDLSLRDFETNATILDGQNARRVLYQPENFNTRTSWDGFTIQNGYANGPGGGVYMLSNARLANCLVQDNVASVPYNNQGTIYGGGGVCVRSSSDSSEIAFCRIRNNETQKYGSGGGVWASHAVIHHSDIVDNRTNTSSSRSGGGVYASFTNVLNCTIVHNTAQEISDGYYNHSYGGGIYLSDATVVNSLIAENSAYYGGGVCGYGDLFNTTVVSNNADNYAGVWMQDGDYRMVNSVLWGNRRTNGNASNLYVSYGACQTIHSAVEGGISGNDSVMVLSGENSGLDAGVNYPFFVSPQTGDYRLCKYSALVNAGVNGIQIQETDLSDMPRVFADTIDIGCYEFHGEAFCATPQNLAVSDISGTSALLTWQNPNPDSPYAYEFSYKSEDENQWTSVLVYEPEYYVLTGLQAQTIYTIRMRTLCDDVTPTEYTSEVFFSTKCTGETTTSDTIGNTSTTTNGHIIPIRFQSSYSYSQQIYQASEIAGERILDTLKLRYRCMSSGSTLTRNVDIYLGHTDRPSFDDNAGFVTSDSLTLLYSGDLTLKYASDNPVISVPLDKPFRYNGVDNLIIAFDDNTGTDGGTSRRLCTHRTQQSSSLHTYSYNGDIDPANPTAGTLSTYRMNLILPGVCENGGCDLSGLSLMGVTENTATLLVQAGTNADGVEVQYKERASDEYLTIPVDSLMCQLTGLRQNTDYVVRARSVCGDTSSLWTYRYFTTEVKDFARIYVTTIGQGEGNSWATACNDLNYALSTASRIASVFGHTPDIWVAAGTYYGDTASTNAFTMVQGVNVYGGFVGNEPSDYDVSLRDVETNATVLDGQHSRRVLLQSSAFTVQTTWDGFTIQNGNISSYGGGAYLRSRSYLSHCKLVNNHASYGGGAYVAGYGSVIRDCRVSDNSAVYKGGGIQAMTYSTVVNCVISGNSTTNNVYYYYGGGGIYAEGATIVSCEISNNSTVREGGAVNMTSSQVRNCLLANNSSNNAGGGVHGSGNIINSTIVNNRSGNGVGGLLPWGPVTLTNSIVWGNQTGDGTPSNLSDYNLTCSHSAIEDGSEGDSVIVLNDINQPLFVNPSLTAGANDSTVNVDWHLQQGSPCINVGNNTLVTDSLDLDGTTRIKRDTVDLGCYESDYYSVPMTVYDSIIYVTVTGAGTHSGNSWANAISSIEEAQVLAQSYGAMVWVAAGTYYGDTTAANAFTMIEDVNVYGGFAGNEPTNFDLSLRDFDANVTILDGMNARRVLNQPGVFNIQTKWDGFTIRNGQTSANGGGVYLQKNGVLSQCEIMGCNANGGGGVYVSAGTISECLITGCTAGNGGGVNCTYKAVILSCKITSNSATGSGGGVFSYNSTIMDCSISGNEAGRYGGGVYCYYRAGVAFDVDPTNVIRCKIIGNYSSNSGGGICMGYGNDKVKNSLVSNNTSNMAGGGISGSGHVFETTVVRNVSNNGGSGVNGNNYTYLKNSIVWGNERNGAADNLSNDIICSFSAIEGGHEGDSVIVLNDINPPMFVNPSLTAGAGDTTANVDWHLLDGSVCVNHGDNALVTDSLDLDGTARIKRDTVDMGCYESDFYSVPVLYCTTVYGEFSDTTCDSYTWNDQSYTRSGDYSQSFALANGCDSIVTLHLTVNYSVTANEYLTICENDLPFTYGDTVFGLETPALSTTTFTLSTVNGCDSIVTLFLTVLPSTVGDFTVMTPTENYPITNYPVRFTWDAVENASHYDLYVWPAGESQPQQPTASRIRGTSYSLSSLANRGAYQWFMTAYNDCDTSVSTTRHFTLNVTPTLTVNTSNPVDFGEVQLNAARSIFFQVNGNALDSAISYQLTGADSTAFTLVSTTVWDSLHGGRMQLSFHPVVAQGEYTAQMTFYSDTLARTFTIKGHLADYLTFTTYVDSNVYAMDSQIPIHGRVTNPLHEPVAGLAVEVYVSVMDYVRTIPAVSDANGQFTVMFTPQHSEAGYYTVGSRRAGGNSTEVHDDFNIPGMMLVSSDWILWEPTIDQPDSGRIAVRNRSQIPLTNIRVTPVSLPNGCSVQFEPLNIAGMATGYLQYVVSGSQVSTGVNYEEVPLNAASDEGAAMNFMAWYYCMPQRADLDVTPTSLITTMTRGRSKVVDLKIYNNGTGPTGNIYVSLPDVPWMSVVGNDTLPSLAVHDSAYVSIRLSADSAELVRYTGHLAINCERGEGVSIPYDITGISDSTGTLLVDVTDEYTWNTNGGHGPHLAGANIMVKGYYSLETVATGVTDANGHFVVNNLPEGYYKLIVRAERHEEYQGNLLITAGDTNRQDIFIQFQAITYSWDVVPTEIQDEYTYDLNVVFETHVPKPVVILETSRIIPELEVGETMVFDLIVTNYGLITANDVEIFFPTIPNHTLTPLISTMDSIPALSTFVIPVEVRHNPPMRWVNVDNPLETDSDACWKVIGMKYSYICGPDKKWQKTNTKKIYKVNVCALVSLANFSGSFDPPRKHEHENVCNENTKIVDPIRIRNDIPCVKCDEILIEVDERCLPIIGDIIGAAENPNYTVEGGASATYLTNKALGPLKKYRIVKYASRMKYMKNTREDKTCLASIGKYLKCRLRNSDGSSRDISRTRDSFVGQSEIEHLQLVGDVLDTYVSILMHLISDEIYNTYEDAPKLLDHSDSIIGNLRHFTSIDVNNLVRDMSAYEISESDVRNFAHRWNKYLDVVDTIVSNDSTVYYIDDISSLTLSPINITYMDSLLSQSDSLNQIIHNLGYNSLDEIFFEAKSTIDQIVAGMSSSSVCASVTVQFSQKMTMTREAFEGTLTINNGHESQPMQDIDVNFVIKDENGVDCTNLFQINFLSYNNMSGTNGSAALAAQNAGSIVVQFIPTKQAAPEISKVYSFGGSFSFIDPFTGEFMTYNLYPVDIMVHPSPDLYVNYFMQRDILGDDPLTEDRIEPIVPAELGVIIHNRGAGTAKNVLLETAEPKIIDNEKGLAVDFAMYGAAFNGNERQLGLKEIPFGNIEPGRTGVGEWWFTSTLLGHFVSYDAHVIHNNSFGNPDLSLVSSLAIHPLIHTVYAYGNLDDGINDFLVDDVADIRNYPDSLYFSNGSRTGVAIADSIGFDHYVTPVDTIVQLTLDPSRIGWNYEQTWDPGRGQYKLISCTRNRDQQAIPLSNVWQSFVTLPVGADPIYENRLHIVDTLSNDLPTTYTLVFSLREMTLEVDTILNVPDSIVTTPLAEVTVVFNKPIVDSTFNYLDMSLKCNNGANLLDANLQVERIDSKTYKLHLAPYTNQTGYYVLNIQTLNVTDENGYNGYYGKQATWIQNIMTCVPVYNSLNLSICENELPYHYVNGQIDTTFSLETPSLSTLNFKLSTIHGCDSTVILRLTVNHGMYTETTVDTCGTQYYWALADSTITNSGTYYYYSTNANTCTDTTVLRLALYQSAMTELSAQICAGEVYVQNGFNVSTAGDHYLNLQTTHGCDSTVVLHLTVNHGNYTETTVDTCGTGYYWALADSTINQSGTYYHYSTNANTCTDTAVLMLSLYQSA
nr:choice-of-anchor J domain-containing protein [Bacteroidales bacterium]